MDSQCAGISASCSRIPAVPALPHAYCGYRVRNVVTEECVQPELCMGRLMNPVPEDGFRLRGLDMALEYDTFYIWHSSGARNSLDGTTFRSDSDWVVIGR